MRSHDIEISEPAQPLASEKETEGDGGDYDDNK